MKRLLPSNIRPSYRGNISVLTVALLMGTIILMTTGCAPELAHVNTGGLLTRSFSNYSQSTVVKTEKLMTSEMPDRGTKTPVPKNISSKKVYTNSAANKTINRNRTKVVTPTYSAPTSSSTTRTVTTPAAYSKNVTTQNNRNYTVTDIDNTTSEAIIIRQTGIPKVTEKSVSKIGNVTFVTPQQLQDQSASIPTPKVSNTTPTTATTLAPKATTAKQRRALLREQRAEEKQLLSRRKTESRTQYSTVVEDRENDHIQEITPVTTPFATMTEAVSIPDATITDNTTDHSFFGESTENSAESEAIAPPVHNFKSLEIEHVKYSYYDPFGKNNNRFIVVLNEQRFCYPIKGKYLSGYGYRGRSMHTGLDIKGNLNDTIRAIFAGTVRMSKTYSGYGNCVVIRHRNGLETMYSHNNRNLVKVGDRVSAGDPIALIGRTGRATTEHCHFEVRIQGQHINPALILDYQNHRLRDGVLAVTKQSGGKIIATNKSSGLAPSEAVNSYDSEVVTSKVSVYTVKSGDTLSGIAVRHGTTVTRICALNSIDRNSVLQLGKRLKLQ